MGSVALWLMAGTLFTGAAIFQFASANLVFGSMMAVCAALDYWCAHRQYQNTKGLEEEDVG